jgi:hypothetical protein
MKNKQKQNRSIRELPIIILLFTFCFLVIILRLENLYDLVRNCIIAILVVYLGWQGLSRRNTHPKNHDNMQEDNNDE